MATDSTKGRTALDQPVKPVVRKGPSRALAFSGSSGPRTLRGKQKSRYNALKHGIFAQVVLRGSALKESTADYLNLLESFRERLQPVGGVEEMLVEKLAMLAWRNARAVRAEVAIIMKQTEFLRSDREARLKGDSEGDMLQLAKLTGGIARKLGNPYLLSKSLQVLEALRYVIEERGFEPDTDERVLQGLYGESGKGEGLFLSYGMFAERAKEAAEKAPEPQRVIQECKKDFLGALEAEMERIEGEIKQIEAREEVELPLMEESLAIPQEEELDRLLRYEARLDGSFDRTLTQLERLQRTRLGQPLPPTVKVDVSH